MKRGHNTVAGAIRLEHGRRNSADAAQISRIVFMRRALMAAIVVLATGAPTASHAESFQGLGFLSGDTGSTATGVSGDGSVVVGTSGTQAFRWTAAGGMVGLGYLSGNYSYSSASGVNGDGSVVVGGSGITQAYRWTAATGMVGLGYLLSYDYSLASGVNGDGSVVVGSNGRYNTGGGRRSAGLRPAAWSGWAIYGTIT